MNIFLLGLAVACWFVIRSKGHAASEHAGQAWLWLQRIGVIFLILMLFRNAEEVYAMMIKQSDAWWPLVKQTAERLLTSFRTLLQTMTGGG